MLERIQIKNFQKHQQLRLVFAAPGVTTITGDNDRGKSSIIRALRWAMHNRPSRESIRRRVTDNAYTEEDTVVTLWVDGHKLVRRRGDMCNEYELDDQVYKALGRDVPEPIANLLNMGPDNTQGQLEGVFWFEDTAGTVSEHLNAVVNLGIMDEVLSDLRNRERQTKGALTAANAAVEVAKVAKQGYGYVDSLTQDINVVEAASFMAEELQTQAANLQTTVATANGWLQRAAAARVLAGLGTAAATAAATAGKAARNAATLRTLVNTPRPRPLPKGDPAALRVMLDNWREKRAGADKLARAIGAAQRAFGATCTASETQAAAQEDFQALTQDEVCPICQKPFQ
jgi:hypothetical protein